MRDDLKAAVRSLRSARGFTFAALVVLTLGIGATTAIFSVVDAVVLRGLPFDEHDRLVAVGERTRATEQSRVPSDPAAVRAAAPQNYLDWAAQQQVFASIGGIADGELTLRQPGAEPVPLVAQRVTAGFFNVLGVSPAIGHPFAAENQETGRDRVAVLSDRLWRNHFDADPLIVGRVIPLEALEGRSGTSDGGGYQVAGVMPPEFAYPVGAARPTDVWVPYVVPPTQRLRDPTSKSFYLQVIARLKPNVSLPQAQAQMDQVGAAIEQANPEWNRNNTVGVRPLVDHIVGTEMRSWMLMLLGAVSAVLLIACANIANLFLARAQAHEREAGIRAALGATRWRLIRQLMTESLVLSAVGTACAVVVAWWAVELLRTSMPESVPRVTAITLDLRVLIVAAGLSLITGILFGAVPALQLSKPDLSNGLKDGARSTAGAGRRRLRSVLVIAELALAVILLVGAGLFIGSFVSLIRIHPGFDQGNLLTAQVSPPVESRTPSRDLAAAFTEIVERIKQIPGVTHASMIAEGSAPLSSSIIRRTSFFGAAGKMIEVSYRRVTPDYHQALGIPLLNGRLFDDTDVTGAPAVVILNASAAREYFPGENPMGRVFGSRTVVGVVGDVRHVTLEMAPLTAAYVPIAQSRVSAGDLVIRTRGNPYDVLPALKAAVFAQLPDVPLRNIRTMEELLARQLAQRRLSMLLLGLFGLLGLVIAAVGVYGVIAYLVSQRTREIGVRIALGASRSNIVAMVLMNAGTLVGSGLVIGGAAAWYLSAASKAFLFQLEPTDPRVYAIAVVTLLIASLAASAIPARRAASVDPMLTMRAE